jgi:kynurenine formamidase/2-keto-3-deoxy-L-rhamnonate aldolase RhmA
MVDMTAARLRKMLGQTDIGMFWLALGHVAAVEAAARAGADAIVLDLQHGLWTRESVEGAVASAGEAPIVARVADNSAVAIGQALDAGCEGVLVPLVETRKQAARAVSHARFPPAGNRSGGGVRPLGAGFMDYVKASEGRTVLGVMIETKRGLDNVDEIVSVPGIDYVFIGTGDLSLSLAGDKAGPDAVEAACRRIHSACRAAGVPCGIFTGDAAAAARRRDEGYDLVVVGGDNTILESGFKAAGNSYRRPPSNSKEPAVTSSETLASLAGALLAGSVDIVDLTATLGPNTPVLYLPPQFGKNTPNFRSHEISHYDENGPWWAWNWMELGEHTGTHFDAPIHWISGKDRPNNTTDTISPKGFVAPCVVIDCSREVARNPDYLLTADGVRAFEAQHGPIQPGSWVLMRSDWYHRNYSTESFLNADDKGSHTPGPSVDCIRYLAERGIVGWGSECVGTDAGNAAGFEPPFPAHNLLLSRGSYGLASLVNLDRLPPTGAILIAAPLKIEMGTGSPVRALALVPRT